MLPVSEGRAPPFVHQKRLCNTHLAHSACKATPPRSRISHSLFPFHSIISDFTRPSAHSQEMLLLSSLSLCVRCWNRTGPGVGSRCPGESDCTVAVWNGIPRRRQRASHDPWAEHQGLAGLGGIIGRCKVSPGNLLLTWPVTLAPAGTAQLSRQSPLFPALASASKPVLTLLWEALVCTLPPKVLLSGSAGTFSVCNPVICLQSDVL